MNQLDQQIAPTTADLMAEIRHLQEITALQVKPFWNLTEAAQMLGYSKYHLRKMVARQEIPCYRPSRNKVYFDPKELTDWMKSHRQTTMEQSNAAQILERYINS